MSARHIRLAKDLALPLELVTESVGILAVKRAGKSHTAKRLVEQLHHAGQQVVIVDPKGDWWGIRSSADGKRAGLPFVIVGGGHADVPLDPGAGELVARLAAVDRVSMLLDLAELRKHQVATFMTAFLETLYRLKYAEANRTPLMLVIDEADAIAPQRTAPGEERMLGAAEDIVRRGGQRGIGICLITQRAAVLNKNVLTQVGVLILLRTTGHQDIKAVNEWIQHHQQEARRVDVMKTIAAMPRGTAWVWSPGWPDADGIFQQVEVLPIDTFDSGRTPKPGERLVRPKTLAEVDLVAFKRDMAETLERAKAEDPKTLQARIRELERELARKRTPTPAAAKIREVPVVRPSAFARGSAVVARAEGLVERLQQLAPTWRDQVERLVTALTRAHRRPPILEERPAAATPAARPPALAAARTSAARPAGATLPAPSRRLQAPAEGLTKGQQAILDTAWCLSYRGIAGSRKAIAAWLDLHPRGGTFREDVATLVKAGYLEVGGAIRPAGEALARPGLTGLEGAAAALGGTQQRILEKLLELGRPVTRRELAESLGLHARGGTFRADVARLVKMGLITRGPIGTTEGLMR